jgi:K+-sensing histidine kinase KdpD
MSPPPDPRSHILAPPPPAPIAVLWAGAAAAAPTLIRLALDHVVSDITVFPAYFPFVLAAATFLGWRAAVVTAVVSALAANFMFMGERFEFSSATTDVVSTLVFLVSASAVIFGVERLKSATPAADLDHAASPQARSARRPLSRGHGLLLAALLSLCAWVSMIWGASHAIRLLLGS